MSSRHQKSGKGRKDEYYFLAKESGYRSRAAFKLLQLDKKYNFLGTSRCLIDLCAAPGGWSQVAAKAMPVGSLILSVDLDPIKPIPGIKSFQADITTQRCRAILKQELVGWSVDTVIHDGAPNMGTDWSSDAYMQSVLVLWSAKLACEFLRPGGTFVSKIFRSTDYLALLFVLNQLFAKVEVTKPKSSRDTSAEVFAVCMGYKAPSNLDDRLFDPNIVFKSYAESQDTAGAASGENAAAAAKSLKQLSKDLSFGRRHRTGYDEANITLHKALPIVEFVTSPTPIIVFANYNEISFESPAAVKESPRFRTLYASTLGVPAVSFNGRAISSWDEYAHVYDLIAANARTTAELRTLLKDVKMLSRKDFKHILQWREKVLSAICDATLPTAGHAGGAPALSLPQPQPQTQLQTQPAHAPTTEEIAELQNAQLAAARRKEVRRAERRRAKAQLKSLKRFMQGDPEGLASDVALAEQSSLFGAQHVGLLTGALGLSAADSADGADGADGAGAATLAERLDTLAREVAADPSLLDSSSERDSADASAEDSDVFVAPEEERRRYLDNMSGNIDALYDEFLVRQERRECRLRELEDMQRRAQGLILGNEAAGGDAVATASLTEKWFSNPAFRQTVRDRGDAPAGTAGPASAAEAADVRAFRDADEYYDAAVPLPKDALSKTRDHARRVKEIARQARLQARKARSGVGGAGGAKPTAIEMVAGEEPLSASSAEDSTGDGHGAAVRDSMRLAGDRLVDARSVVALHDGLTVFSADRTALGRTAESGPGAPNASDSAGGSSNAEDAPSDAGSSAAGENAEESSDADLLRDPHNKALKLAVAAKMLRKKGREEVRDASYTRYTFYNDEDAQDLPAWFVKDEARHTQPIAPITKEEYERAKARVEELQARPIKKVREAVARKRMRAYTRLQGLASKADSLAARTDISEREKVAIVAKAAAKVRQTGERKKTKVVVSNRDRRKALPGAAPRGSRFVDRRLKKDLRKGHAMAGGHGKKAMRKSGIDKVKLGLFKAKHKRR